MNRNQQIIDYDGNIWQRTPAGEWFIAQSNNAETPRTDTVVWRKPGVSDRALDWFFFASVVSLGLIGVWAVLS